MAVTSSETRVPRAGMAAWCAWAGCGGVDGGSSDPLVSRARGMHYEYPHIWDGGGRGPRRPTLGRVWVCGWWVVGSEGQCGRCLEPQGRGGMCCCCCLRCATWLASEEKGPSACRRLFFLFVATLTSVSEIRNHDEAEAAHQLLCACVRVGLVGWVRMGVGFLGATGEGGGERGSWSTNRGSGSLLFVGLAGRARCPTTQRTRDPPRSGCTAGVMAHAMLLSACLAAWSVVLAAHPTTHAHASPIESTAKQAAREREAAEEALRSTRLDSTTP